MARTHHWWNKAPRWAWAVIVAGLVACVAFAVQGRPEPTSVTPAPASVGTVDDPAQILVIGDSYTAGSTQGGVASLSWPRVMVEALHAHGLDVTLDVDAEGGSGYAKPGRQRNTFPQLVRRSVTAETDLVVFLGSRNDTAPKAALEAAAVDAFTAVRAVAPGARLLVIGPPWVDDRVPAYLLADRDAVAAATAQVGGGFVDPLAEGWFSGGSGALIGADGVHPTDAGHRHMAELIAPRVRAALGG
jgi:lysophospholipase L1-like esterase